MDEESIFTIALTHETPAERKAYLDAACAGNPELRSSVEELLQYHEHDPHFLNTPALDPAETVQVPADARGRDAVQEPVQQKVPNAEQPPLGATHVEPIDSSEILLDFLQPTDDPKALGRIGQYTVTEVIGRGGMGLVLKGLDTRLNRVAAIKVLAPELATNATARKRFLREAQAAAAVNHPHVVTTYVIDEEQNFPYIAMEYIEGPSLQERIDQQGPLEVERILRIARQTALGLAAAHDQGLIHRDVKPANILLENGIERVKLSDFGLARAIDDVSTTQTGVVAGTPEYMSPEQAQGKRVDHRSDLFSLGSVMYAMCTGRSPFREETAVAVLRRVCDEEPRAIGDINPDIPGWLIQIIRRLLAKSPDDRFQSAHEVAELLAKCLAHQNDPSQHSLPALGFQDKSTAPVRKSPPGRQRCDDRNSIADVSPRRSERGRFSYWAAVAAGLLLIVALGVTDATGVTDLKGYLATVLKIRMPDGTLIVDVKDPNIAVTIEGEDVVIRGAGVQEVRLKPGFYRLRAEIGEEVVYQELVEITRNGQQLVKIDLEPARNADPITPSQPISSFAKTATTVGKEGHHYAAGFFPDGRSVFMRSRGDLATISETSALQRISGVFNAHAFTPDGTKLLLGTFRAADDGPNELGVFDVETGEKLSSLGQSTGVIQEIDVSPDQRYAASAHAQWWGSYEGRDQTIRIWDLEAGELLTELTGHKDQVMSVEFLPSGNKVLSGSRDGTVCLWNVTSGAVIRRFEGAGTEVFAVAASPDGKYVLAGYGPDRETGIQGTQIDDVQHCVAVLWETETGNEVRRFVGHRGCISDVTFSPDGKLIATASGEAHVGEPLPGGGSRKTRDNTARVWDASSGELLAILPHRTSVKSVAFSPDGTQLVTGEWHQSHLWQVPESLRKTGPIPDPENPTGKLLVSSNREGNYEIYLIENLASATSGDDGVNLTNHPAEDSGAVWSPDGKQIAFCSRRSGNHDIWVMEADGSNPRQLTDFEGIDRTPAWSPDGKRIAFTRHLSPDNWEIFVMNADGSQQVNLSNQPGKDAGPAWSPDGNTIAFSYDGGGTQLYLMQSDGSDVRLLSTRQGSYVFADWSPDGQQIVFSGWADKPGGDLELFVINSDGTNERQLTQLGGFNAYAAWSPDGNWIAFEHRNPDVGTREATLFVTNVDGTVLVQSSALLHVGYGGGRPSWKPSR